MRCIPLFDVSLVGDVEVIAIVDAPAHDSGLSVADGCLAPNAKGAWNGIENEVPATLLQDATELRYAITGLERDWPLHPLTPTLISRQTLLESELYAVAGQIRSASSAIYNTSITFYARNELGLLVDTALAYPLDLDTLPADTTLDYRSGAFLFEPGEPQGLLHFFSFISGPAPAALASALVLDSPSEESARSRRAADVRAELTSALQRLDGR
jgi:hypothetical protein